MDANDSLTATADNTNALVFSLTDVRTIDPAVMSEIGEGDDNSNTNPSTDSGCECCCAL